MKKQKGALFIKHRVYVPNCKMSLMMFPIICDRLQHYIMIAFICCTRLTNCKLALCKKD